MRSWCGSGWEQLCLFFTTWFMKNPTKSSALVRNPTSFAWDRVEETVKPVKPACGAIRAGFMYELLIESVVTFWLVNSGSESDKVTHWPGGGGMERKMDKEESLRAIGASNVCACNCVKININRIQSWYLTSHHSSLSLSFPLPLSVYLNLKTNQ